jgi:hypothetical protein
MRARDLMTAPVITVPHRLEIYGSDRHIAQLPALAVPGVVAADTAYAGEEQTR